MGKGRLRAKEKNRGLRPRMGAHLRCSFLRRSGLAVDAAKSFSPAASENATNP